MTSRLKVCVVMCTYNGAAYLDEQLASIAAQTRLPDHMLAVDDASRDNTLDILQEFARQAKFDVRVMVNETNLGYAKNFEKAIGLMDSDIIVLADQDDVWMKHKIAAIEQVFLEHLDVDTVFSDAVLVDRQRKAYGRSLWQTINFSAGQKRLFESGEAFRVLLQRTVITGATMAFRGSLKSRLLPIPNACPHDEWIAGVTAATGRIFMIPQKLIEYRQHGGNQIGVSKPGIAERVKRLGTPSGLVATELFKACALRKRLTDCPTTPLDRMAELDSKIQHLGDRIALPTNRVLRIAPVLRDLILGRYRRYSLGWMSALHDLIEPA